MPIGRGLPTRKSAPGKAKSSLSAATTGSRRRSRGLPLTGGGASSSEAASSARSSSPSLSNSRSRSPSSARPSAASSSSLSSKKKKKSTSKAGGSSHSNSSASSKGARNPVKTEPGLSSSSSQRQRQTAQEEHDTQAHQLQVLEAKLDKKSAVKFSGGNRRTQGSSSNVWAVKLIVNGKVFDNNHSSVNRRANFSIGRNGGDETSTSLLSRANQKEDEYHDDEEEQQQNLQEQEPYRPRRFRDVSSDQSNSSESLSKHKGKDGNFHYCNICGEVGDVVCCDGCPHVYHPQCLPADSESFAALDTQHDDDPWYCPDCFSSKKKRKRKGSISNSGANSRGGAGSETMSPYRQQRPKRKCSYDADAFVQDDSSDESDNRKNKYGKDGLLLDEDGDPVAVDIAEDDAYDEEDAEISEAMESPSSTTSYPKSKISTPSKSSRGSSTSGKTTAPKNSSSPSLSSSGVLSSASKKKSNSNKKQKTTGATSRSRSASPVRSRAASPTLSSRIESSSSDMKKKDKKKKKKKRKKEHSDGTARSNSGGSRADGNDRKTRNDKSDGERGGGMLSHVLNNNASGLVKAVPAFYFFLNENRNKIDRNLSRKHRYFNRLPKANMERNQLIAKEGIIMWGKLSDLEVKRYIDISMKDFERRIMEWKEAKILRSMFLAAEGDGGDASSGEQQQQQSREVDRNLLLEDERLTRENHQRLYLGTTVGYKPYKPDLEESNNRILLELLQDTRFHPLPMIQSNRPAQEYGEMDFDRITIPYFDVNGPVSTCLGDECLGCARGWNHFCNVLKRKIPAVARRAKLQPPLSSLVATRIGLGLKNPLLTEDNQDEENGGEKKNGASPIRNINGGIKKSSDENVETFTARDIPSAAAAKALPHYPWESLTAPTERADDVVRFVEEAVCMKIPEPHRPRGGDYDSDGFDENKKKAHFSPTNKTIRFNLPLRKERRRRLDDFGNSSVAEDEDNEEITVNKCGRCRTIIEGDTGCVPCRRAQLVINMSRGEGQADESEASRMLRIQTNMLGRVVMRDSEVESQEQGDEAVSNYILRQRWTPFTILPPSTLTSPMLREDGDSVDTNESESDDDNDGNDDVGENGSEENGEGAIGRAVHEDCVPTSMDIDSSEENSPAKAVSDDAASDDPIEEESSTQASNHDLDARPPPSKRLRASSRLGALESNGAANFASISKVNDANDRHLLTKKFKEEATMVNRKCISISCYGILLALKRRDPLLHFAEPVVAEGYSDIIKKPMDFGKIKKNVLRNNYATLGAFISDVRLLCDNAIAFNPPDSIYSKTAKELLDVLAVMQKRASEWISTLKDAHASTFNNIFNPQTIKNSECEVSKKSFLGGDPFHRLRKEWPEAVELYEDNEWLQKSVETDFMRTKENESAYYGSLAIRRAAMAAAMSLAPYTDSDGMYNTVGRRTHIEDENLRNFIAKKVAESVHPPELKELPSWREETIMRVLRKSQARRMEGKMGSTHGCARCDGVRVDPESNKAMNVVKTRWGRTRKKPNEVPRIHKSRLGLSTGLGSQNTQERIRRHKASDIRKGLRKGSISALVAAADKVNEVAVTARGSRIHGMGLFADQALQKGDVVAEYVGEYVSPAVTEKREKGYQKERIQDYQFRIDSQLVIDATKQGGHGRYANHNCDPNCATKIIPFKLEDEAVKTTSNGNILKRVVIVALRDIEPMEELTYDYQFPLEVDLDERIPCNCNSELCRGFMNWDLPEKGARNQDFRTQKRGANMRDRIRRLGRPLKGDK
ncbi:unnamed protein product [Pseudo-nitzschia multistriata]|uniref:[histone H3]-lysine(4) N-trimethyltransferase n=1 Tax=Pseudo-nitzschia multistriata TaxID=183589 RepID=A0A448ZG10_9STRA|nr:unnamed protein product [Pseudo-nitzschia multistriata]